MYVMSGVEGHPWLSVPVLSESDKRTISLFCHQIPF